MNENAFEMAVSSVRFGAGVPAEVGSIDMLFTAEPMAGELDPLAAAFDGGYVATRGTIDEVFAGGAQ